MTISTFIYQNIFCRYLTPGQCVIHDRGGEFCNNQTKLLMNLFNVDIRPIHAGHPQSNGQVEKYVGILKRLFISLEINFLNFKHLYRKKFLFKYYKILGGMRYISEVTSQKILSS